jgi:hypothetical protein
MDIITSDIKVGQDIFENVPNEVRPNWGALILSRFDGYVENTPSVITKLRENISDPGKWKLASKRFNEIRQLNLNNDSPAIEIYLILAECVAQVTYNESNPSDPYKANCGFFIPKLALNFADKFNDKVLYREVKLTILLFQGNPKLQNGEHSVNDVLLHKKTEDIIWFDWDPKKLNGTVPRREYQNFVDQVFELKKSGANQNEIAEKLLEIETSEMGMSGDRKKSALVANKIFRL